MLTIIRSIDEWKKQRQQIDTRHLSIGLVPTMGNLHAGHMHLVDRARAENDFIVVTIFVNPTQFNNVDDLKKYPRTLEDDFTLLRQHDVDFVFVPGIETMYPLDYRFQVHESKLSKIMEGVHRPGHFDGMMTIVLKLLLLIRAQRAYFGEKDYQQLQLVKDMAQAFFTGTDIIACATVRDEHGLALSSRNSHLSEHGVSLARQFAAILQSPMDIAAQTKKMQSLEIEVEYIEDYQQRRYAAVHIDGVRLIDNVELKC